MNRIKKIKIDGDGNIETVQSDVVHFALIVKEDMEVSLFYEVSTNKIWRNFTKEEIKLHRKMVAGNFMNQPRVKVCVNKMGASN